MRLGFRQSGFALLIATASLTPTLTGCGDDSATRPSGNSAPNIPGDPDP
jgi:hypothetical protein